MAQLDKGQLALLKRIQQEDGWDVIMRALQQHIDDLRAQEITGNNEFETLRALHKNQGKVDGLLEFFEKVEKQSFD